MLSSTTDCNAAYELMGDASLVHLKQGTRAFLHSTPIYVWHGSEPATSSSTAGSSIPSEAPSRIVSHKLVRHFGSFGSFTSNLRPYPAETGALATAPSQPKLRLFATATQQPALRATCC